jgi:hypothetical protein
MFHWTLHTNLPTRKKILHSAKHIADVDKNITKILDEDGLFDEFIHNANVNETIMDGTQNHLQLLKDDLIYCSVCGVNVFHLHLH